MISRSSIIFILLLNGLMFTYGQRCDRSIRAEDRLQSGTIEFIGNNLETYYPNLQTFLVPILNFDVDYTGYQIAVSTSLISEVNIQNGFQYSIVGNKQALGNALSLTLYQGFEAQWNIIRVSYLVSSNSEIILGRRKFLFPVPVISPPSQTQVYLWVLSSRIQQNVQYQAFVFISGLKIVGVSQFQVAITSNILSEDRSRVLVNLRVNGLTQLSQILFYYILYPEKSENFYFGSQVGTYQMWGARAFSEQFISNSKFTICKKIDEFSCLQNEHFENQQCVCNEGYIQVYDNCQKQCGVNEYYNNQNQCVCLDEHYKIQGICKLCQNNSQFNGTICQCNNGYYLKQEDVCDPCFDSCATCSGANPSSCLTCHSQQYIFEEGQCKCAIKQYSQNQTCKSCTDNCLTCTNFFICDKCDEKYHLKTDFIGINVKFCEKDCGDGIKQTHEECDDGNIFNNDGCTSLCQIQYNLIKIQHELKFNGVARLFNRTLLQFKLSKYPVCFDAIPCKGCTNMFKIKIAEGYEWIKWAVSYNSIFKTFVIDFTYTEILADQYTVSIQFSQSIPPQMRACLNALDLSQELIYEIIIIQLRFEKKILEQNLNIA